MNNWIKRVKSFLFQLQWVRMSPKEKYACLWARTKKLGDLTYDFRYIAADSSK